MNKVAGNGAYEHIFDGEPIVSRNKTLVWDYELAHDERLNKLRDIYIEKLEKENLDPAETANRIMKMEKNVRSIKEDGTYEL